MFLSQDTQLPDRWSEGMNKRWVTDYRLSLLRQVTVAGASRRPSCWTPRC